MSCEHVFRSLCQFISGSVRLILFFASLLFMIVSIILLILSAQNQTVYSLIEVTRSNSYFYVIIALAIYLVILSLFGIYGSFYKDETIIRWFAFLASLNILIGCGVLMFISPRLVDSSGELQNKLKDSLAKYDWFHNPDSSFEVKNATEKWDNIQTNYQCCGVHSFKDWDLFKPSDSRDLYPKSCCHTSAPTNSSVTGESVCNEKSVWLDGCVDQIETFNGAITWLLTALIMMNLVLGVMASVVIFCSPKRGYQRY